MRVPYERALKWHRWNSAALLLCVLTHSLRMVAQRGWVVVGSCRANAESYGSCFGTAAFVCFLAMAAAAYPPLRRSSWEAFKATHLALFNLVIFLVCWCWSWLRALLSPLLLLWFSCCWSLALLRSSLTVSD